MNARLTLVVVGGVLALSMAAARAQEPPRRAEAREDRDRAAPRRERGERVWRREPGARGPLEELREFVEEVMPGRLERIMALRQTDPARFREMMGDLIRQKRRLDELKERDPAAYEQEITRLSLENETREQAEAAREAKTEEAKKAAKAKLTELVSQLFEIQCDQLEREIQEQAKRLEEMRQLLKKRRAAKDKIVERRVQELTGEDAVLRWEIHEPPRPEPRDAGPRRPEEFRGRPPFMPGPLGRGDAPR